MVYFTPKKDVNEKNLHVKKSDKNISKKSEDLKEFFEKNIKK